jgi:hypothetical protein
MTAKEQATAKYGDSGCARMTTEGVEGERGEVK